MDEGYYGSPEDTVTYGYIPEIHCRKHFNIESPPKRSLESILEKEESHRQLMMETRKIRFQTTSNKNLHLQNKKRYIESIQPGNITILITIIFYILHQTTLIAI